MPLTIEISPRSVYFLTKGREVYLRPHDGHHLCGEPTESRWGVKRYPCGSVHRWLFGVALVTGPM